MPRREKKYLKIAAGIFLCLLTAACHRQPPQHDIQKNVNELDDNVGKDIGDIIAYLADHNGSMGDSVRVRYAGVLQTFYSAADHKAAWSSSGKALSQADSLFDLIRHARDYGLEPSSYYADTLAHILTAVRTDSMAQRDAIQWARLDILLTDDCMKLAEGLHYGHLGRDSLSMRADSSFNDSSRLALLKEALRSGDVKARLLSLQPRILQYRQLQQALAAYNKTYGQRHWDTLPTNLSDTVLFRKMLAKRLLQSGELDSAASGNDASVTAALKKFQQMHDLYPDGVTGAHTLAALNVSAAERFRQAALNLDRWRQFPDPLPDEYILVNIPSYTMQLWRDDTVRLQSRVIVGRPDAPTPLLNSAIINFQLYPYWRVPFSIIVKEMLPAIRKNIGYLAAHNLEIIDRHNNVVDPYTLDWRKYNKHYFPYLIRQMTGLDNSLGIIKFNFRNKYSVYLHDTNGRGLFGRSFRALSHGCVRVQQWDSLAMYLVRTDTLRHRRDSVQKWMADEEQKLVVLNHRIPIYIRYFTCAPDAQGRLVFYEDIYGYDRPWLRRPLQ